MSNLLKTLGKYTGSMGETLQGAGFNKDGSDDLATNVTGIINSVIGVLGIVAVGVIILGGVTYMTSSGDSSKVKKAKDTILYGVIGLVIVLLSYAIVNWVIGLGDNGNASGTGDDFKTQE